MKGGSILRLYYRVCSYISWIVAKVLPHQVKNAIRKFYTPENLINRTIDYGESFIPQKRLDFLLYFQMQYIKKP